MNNLDTPYFVYELVDHRDMLAFYVGITTNLYQRYKQHMSCDGKNALKDSRIQDIRASGRLPIMRTLGTPLGEQAARELEHYWIGHYRYIGVVLLNAEYSSQQSGMSSAQVQIRQGGGERGRKKGGSNERVWGILLYRCRRGHYPADISTSEDFLRMARYYDHHPRMALAKQFVEAELRGEQFDPGDIVHNSRTRR